MASDLLVSWHEGAAKRAIVDFVTRVTKESAPDFVPPDARVTVFDNDGTLWCEKPLPIQADFLLRGLAVMAELDRTLHARQTWKAVVEKDYGWLSGVITKHYAGDDSDLMLIAGGLLKAYEGTTIEEFETTAANFLRSA